MASTSQPPAHGGHGGHLEEHERFGRAQHLVLHEGKQVKRSTRLRDLIHPLTIRQVSTGGSCEQLPVQECGRC